MKPEDIREFARRPRAAVDDAKAKHWAAMNRATGGLATFEAGHALFEHVRRLRPDFPTADERAEDLAHHIELKRRIDAAKDAFPVRQPPR